MSDVEYLREALRHAKTNSHDPRTQVGAVLVSGRKMVFGANRFVASCGDKYSRIEHAERAAIYKAAACGVPTAGCVMYAPWFACADCARGIILAGITSVVGLMSLRQQTPERWQETIALADRMLIEAGVSVRWLNETVGVTVLFDGEQFQC
jgi:deoxycytidylate deaminase